MPAENASCAPDFAVPQLPPAVSESDRNWRSVSAAGNTLLDLIREVGTKRWTPDRLRALVMAWLSIAPAQDLADVENKARAELAGYRDLIASESRTGVVS